MKVRYQAVKGNQVVFGYSEEKNIDNWKEYWKNKKFHHFHFWKEEPEPDSYSLHRRRVGK